MIWIYWVVIVGDYEAISVVKITVITVLELAVCLLIIDVCIFGILNYIYTLRSWH